MSQLQCSTAKCTYASPSLGSQENMYGVLVTFMGPFDRCSDLWSCNILGMSAQKFLDQIDFGAGAEERQVALPNQVGEPQAKH